MSQICNPCAEGQVCLDNLDRYSLQDDVFYFVINCLPGLFCDGNNVMYLVCCEGTVLQETFPVGISAAERNRIINRLIARCMIAEGFCDDGSGGGGGGGGTKNGGNDGTDPDNPVQFYSNRPQSATVRCPDGFPFTYTVPAGVFIARTQEAADAAALNHARTLAATLKVCLSGPLRVCCNGNLYASTIVASGGRGTFRWYVSGALPTGLVSTPIGNNGLRISGIPTTNGNFTFTVRAVDSFGNSMEKPITIMVWGITDTTLPDAFVGIEYVYQIPVTTGTSPYTFSIVSGAFPNGLTMGPDGIILGTPTETGNFTIRIRVVDSAGRTCTKELAMASLPSDPCIDESGDYALDFTMADPLMDVLNALSGFTDVRGFEVTVNLPKADSVGLGVRDVSTGSIRYSMFIRQTVVSYNAGTKTVTVAHSDWDVNGLTTYDAQSLEGALPVANIVSNTSDTITFDVDLAFVPGDEFAIIILTGNTGSSSTAYKASIPSSADYVFQWGARIVEPAQPQVEGTGTIYCDTPPTEPTTLFLDAATVAAVNGIIFGGPATQPITWPGPSWMYTFKCARRVYGAEWLDNPGCFSWVRVETFSPCEKYQIEFTIVTAYHCGPSLYWRYEKNDASPTSPIGTYAKVEGSGPATITIGIAP